MRVLIPVPTFHPARWTDQRRMDGLGNQRGRQPIPWSDSTTRIGKMPAPPRASLRHIVGNSQRRSTAGWLPAPVVGNGRVSF